MDSDTIIFFEGLLEALHEIAEVLRQQPRYGKCRSCEFFVLRGGRSGECHRYAPTPGHPWPAVDVGNGCGEFRERAV